MKEGSITCPSCGNSFEITDALSGQIREHVENEVQQGFVQREKALKKRQDQLKLDQNKLEKVKGEQDAEIEKQLKKRLKTIEKKTRNELKEEFDNQTTDLQDQLSSTVDKLKVFRKNETKLLQEQRRLQEAKEAAELEAERTLNKERAKIQRDAANKVEEEHKLKEMESAKQIKDLKDSISEWKRKAEQGSMETQGEVLELDLENKLQQFFPLDKILPVPKGTRGADISQTVISKRGSECGVILWETKNTKAWSNKWIPKLKDDTISVRATLPILVSVALPESVERFGLVDGVWVSDQMSAIPLAMALREQLLALEGERQMSVGKSEKKEILFQYLGGIEFKQKIIGIVEAFEGLQTQLNKERSAMERQWKQREKLIECVVKNTVGLYGDMQGIYGESIPQIPELELESGEHPSLSSRSK